MNTALLLIDIQNDYFHGGRMELQNPTLAATNASKILSLFREKKLQVIHVQHISLKPNATFFLPETDGVEIHSKVKPLEDEIIVQKNFPNSFKGTNLENILLEHHIGELTICGMMTHMCIDATVRAAKDKGYKVNLIHDACATKDLQFGNNIISANDVHNAFLAALNGLYADIYSTEEYIDKLKRNG
jgi:nicotinamidase-related amidase